MAAIENFVLKIKVEGQKAVDDLSKSVTSLGTTIGGFGGYAGKMTSAISGIVGGMAGMATIAGTAATAFVGLGLRAIALADELSDISDATGIAAGALNNFRNSLLDAGGKTEDFSTLAAKLNQNLGEAAGGNETAQKAFQKLGVFVRDAGGNVRNTGDVLRDAVAKLAAIEDPAKRAALAVDIFGKSAAKLDFTKLNAGNDFAKDAQIAQLAKYQTAIDAIAKSVNNSLITAFGKLAISIDTAQKKAEKAEAEANARGNTRQQSPGAVGASAAVVNPFGLGGAPAGERQMTDRERAKFELAKKLAEAYKDQGREMSRLESIGKTSPATGDFGADSEAKLKAAAESQKRITQSVIESQRFAALAGEDAKTAEALRGANERIAIDAKAAGDIKNIQINLAQDIKKAAEDVRVNDKISTGQQNAEIAAKTKELQTKSALEIQKIKEKSVKDAADYTMKMNAKIFSEEESQRQKIAEELAAEEKRINDIVESSRKVVDEIANQNAEMAAKAKFSLDSAMMTDQERANAQQLFDIEQQRLTLLKQIADIKDLPYAERLAKEKAVNDLLNQRRTDAQVAQNEQQLQRADFTSGWEKSYRQYVENSTNAAQQGQQAFETLSRGFEDAFTKMFRAGEVSFKNLKAGFKDLANSMIADFIRIQARQALLGLFGGSGGFFSSLFGGSTMAGPAVLGLPGYANGGSIPAGQLSVVGERGPELFIPKTAGTIVPNGAMGGTQVINNAVTYSIQAVDASSFRSLIARDPEFIHNVSEQGRRQMPIRSRR